MNLLDPYSIILGITFILFIFYLSNFKNEDSYKGGSLNLNGFKDCSIPNISYRDYLKSDEERCLAIYRDIESQDVIPKNEEHHFLEWLNKKSGQRFVILQNDSIIATCGMETVDDYTIMIYGLIHPDYQRKGLGGIMLALRLAKMSGHENYYIVLNATEISKPYYARFGFIDLPNPDEDTKVPSKTDDENLHRVYIGLNELDRLQLEIKVEDMFQKTRSLN